MSVLPKRMLEAPTLLDHMERIDYKAGSTARRLTSIIATIGPSSRDEETIYRMLKAGMDVARINFSHESHAEHKLSLKLLKRAEKRYSKEKGYGYLGGIVGALKGREIRIGTFFEQNSVVLNPGDTLKLVTNYDFYNKCTKDIIYVDYDGFIKEVEIGQQVFLDDNAISMEIRDIDPDFVSCKVLIGGTVRHKVTVVVPEATFSLPILSAKDLYDIEFCINNNVQYLMLAKIYTKDDVLFIRNALGEPGKHIKIITKIENCCALSNFDDIASVSDSVLISRIDLAIELKVGREYLAQKVIIARCLDMVKPVFIGQQLLMSMKDSPVPYRADICDIGSAVVDGADGVMLSCVTAVGQYPVEAVKTLADACHEAEVAVWYPNSYKHILGNIIDPEQVTAISAVKTAFNADAAVIVVITVSGQSALLISNYRPKCPIVAVTHSDDIARKVNLHRGVFPINTAADINEDHEKSVERDVHLALTVANQMGIVKNSDAVVLVTPWEQSCAYANNVKIIFACFDKDVECVPEKQNRLVKRL